MQTSIEWLIEQYNKYRPGQMPNSQFKDVCKQAKEMHKREIIKSNRDGVDMVIDKKRFVTGEQYYQNTFKKD